MRSTRYVVLRNRIVFNVATTAGSSTVSTMALRFPGKAISGPPNPRLAIPSPREMEPLTPDPRPERSVHRGVQSLRSEALELPTPVPEHLARAEVGDAPGGWLLLGLVSHLTLLLARSTDATRTRPMTS